MMKLRLAFALLPVIVSTPALAASIVDATGDILPSFVGVATPDLDVTDFAVSLNPTTNVFTIGAVLAGDINPANAGFYVIGVNTGHGANAPFGAIGEPNVTFDQVIIVQKNGTATVGNNALTVLIAGNQFIVSVPLSLLPSTGATAQNYGFNIWPRAGATVTGNSQISDFAPNNALLSVNGLLAAVPEPASWAMMLLGFGAIGAAMRFRRDRRSRPIAQLA
jgi:opacity protein-like surface antigen